jgi:hypothetical protein
MLYARKFGHFPQNLRAMSKPAALDFPFPPGGALRGKEFLLGRAHAGARVRLRRLIGRAALGEREPRSPSSAAFQCDPGAIRLGSEWNARRSSRPPRRRPGAAFDFLRSIAAGATGDRERPQSGRRERMGRAGLVEHLQCVPSVVPRTRVCGDCET